MLVVEVTVGVSILSTAVLCSLFAAAAPLLFTSLAECFWKMSTLPAADSAVVVVVVLLLVALVLCMAVGVAC